MEENDGLSHFLLSDVYLNDEVLFSFFLQLKNYCLQSTLHPSAAPLPCCHRHYPQLR